MTFKMLKRRYRSASEDEHLRRLDYFNQPFVPGNDIQLVDDYYTECKALESLSNSFSPDESNIPPDAIQREKLNRQLNNKSEITGEGITPPDGFGLFDFNRINYY